MEKNVEILKSKNITIPRKNKKRKNDKAIESEKKKVFLVSFENKNDTTQK